MSDHPNTALGRWQAITIEHRLIGLFSALLFIFAIAIFVRPDNSVSHYWMDTLGVHPDWVVWVYMVAAFVMPLGWYLWRNLLVVAVAVFPLLWTMAMLLAQLATSSTAPLFHGAMALSVVALSIWTFYVTRELSVSQALLKDAYQKPITDTSN